MDLQTSRKNQGANTSAAEGSGATPVGAIQAAPEGATQAVSKAATKTAAIEINGLGKTFKLPAPLKLRLTRRVAPTLVRALHNVTLRVNTGEIFGLVGRNGQGKTTLIKCISALIDPDQGQVSVFGHDTRRKALEVKRRIGLVTSEERSFYGRLTGRQNLLFYAQLYGLASRPTGRRITELAEIFNFGSMLDRRFQTLSSGNKQKLAILRALLTDPPLILLDEPTRSLDPIAADELRQQIHQHLNLEQQKTILITTHNLAEIESLCQRVGFLYKGELKLCAPMSELRADHCQREQVTLTLRRGENQGRNGLTDLAREVAFNAETQRRGEIQGINGLADLAREVPGLSWQHTDEGIVELSFARWASDEKLDLVLERVRTQGYQVADCDTQRDGLRQIMEQIERDG